MSATFTSFHPKLVIGGTYSGQIVLWDLRSNKRTPVQRSPLSANAHTVWFAVLCTSLIYFIFFIASRLFSECRRHSECSQFDQRFDGRENVLVERRHAVSTSGKRNLYFEIICDEPASG